MLTKLRVEVNLSMPLMPSPAAGLTNQEHTAAELQGRGRARIHIFVLHDHCPWKAASREDFPGQEPKDTASSRNLPGPLSSFNVPESVSHAETSSLVKP
jgi:hypothetical protein